MRITYYHSRPKACYHSMERIFRQVRRALPDGVVATVAISKFISEGLVRRLYNILEAPFRQGDVNHITGDVHYLAYFLRKRKTILTIHDCGNLLLTLPQKSVTNQRDYFIINNRCRMWQL